MNSKLKFYLAYYVIGTIVLCAIVGCGSSMSTVTVYENRPIQLKDNLYVEEFVIERAGVYKYVYVQCDASGNAIHGVSSSTGEKSSSITTTILGNGTSAQYQTYLNLKSRCDELEMYLKLKEKYEPKK